jgi:hypothetical protein
MQLTSIALVGALASTVQGWSYFSIPLGPIGGGGGPAPVTSTCTGSLSYRPLGSFLFGPLFPNPWAGLGGSVTVPNCNAGSGSTPASVCPSGQACRSTSNPCAGPGESCMVPPVRQFPAQQAAADAMCASAAPGAGLVACLSPAGTASMCCAP